MIRFLLPLLLLAAHTARADWPAALEAYDAGDFSRAYDLFDALRTGQTTSAPLEYNLGNAAFRTGRPALALAHYRRAQWLAPNDPDLRANLQRAVDLLGAEWNDLPLTRRLSAPLSHTAWTRLWFGTLTLTALFGILTLRLSPLRPARAWIYPLSGFLLLLSLAGRWASDPARMSTEGILQGDDITARFEPAESSTRHFSLPGGSLVHIEDHTRQWVRIRANDTSGWIPRDNLIPLKEIN